MLRIYRRFWQVNWAEQWQYRANLLMYLLYWLVSPIVYLAVWTSIANSQGSVQGMTANDFVTYYLVLLVVDQLTSDITLHLLATKIQDGTISGELLRPVHPILTNTLVNNIAFKALIFLAFLPVWLLLCLLFQPDFSAVTLAQIVMAVPLIVTGFAINFLFGASITCLAFWTTRVHSLAEFYFAACILFAGQFIPLQLMPPVIQQIAGFLPFQYFIYLPVQTILGEIPPASLPGIYLTGLLWLAFAALLFRWVWRLGLKHYSAVGA